MISEKANQQMDQMIARYPVKRSAMIPMLHLVQAEEGYLSEDGIRLIASKLDLTYMDVSNTASFYTMFYRRPMGKYRIQWCRSISCMLCGGDALREHLESRLGILKGQMTPDGRFSLAEVECLGACGRAPMMQINADYYEDLTPAGIDRILESLK
ncbi:MAG: NADH-quinone oxidoreductase subunit NuoE [Acidobacteria bacterium]|nr:NADH-quinone oxidoreductase subunit NuoE [Acidobacteriota bacterium]